MKTKELRKIIKKWREAANHEVSASFASGMFWCASDLEKFVDKAIQRETKEIEKLAGELPPPNLWEPL